MRFTLLVPAFAIAANAAAVTTTAGPATIANTQSAISSVASEMSKQSPKAEATSSVYVTGKAPSTAPASKTTGVPKANGTKKATTTKVTTTTIKKAAGTTKAPAKTSKKGAAKPAATTVSTKIAAKKNANPKRQASVNSDCSSQPKYYSYTPSAKFNTSSEIITNFLGDSTFSAASKAATTPSGYSWLWQGFYASTNADWYMSYTVHTSYNVSACAAICDLTSGCQSFNIFYERSPSLAPAVGCKDPEAFTTVKCTYWNQYLTTKHASNFGQWRQAFAVVVAGSNAYNKNK